MRRVLEFGLRAGLAALAIATVSGLFANVLPPLDFINHARPLLLVASGAVLALLAQQPGHLRVLAAAIALLNGALFAAPFALTAEVASASRERASEARSIRLLTFNMSTEPRPIDDLIRYIGEAAPDVVLLQEVTQAHAAALHAGPTAEYPFRHVCTHRQGCSQAFLSRIPWVEAQHIYRASGGPEMIWARFDDPRVGRLSIASLHMAWPFTSETQRRHVDRLITFAHSIDGPLILAGDFNLTPWSSMFQRLLLKSGLRSHAMLAGSWPSIDRAPLVPPLFQIDNVLTSKSIRTLSISQGPHLGSDHRPLQATLALP